MGAMKSLPKEARPADEARIPVAAHAEPQSARLNRRESLLLGINVILVAFNLRIAITSISPLLPEIRDSIQLSLWGASILTALPSLCFGLISPAAPALARRFGTERAIAMALVLLTIGTFLRVVPA